MTRIFGQNQPVPLEKPAAPTPAPQPPRANLAPPAARSRHSHFGQNAMLGGTIMSVFWVGICAAFVWGYWGAAVLGLPLAVKTGIVAAALLPPFLFLAFAAALARSVAMSESTRLLMIATDRLFAADEMAAVNAARLAGAVRRQLDGLNTGLDVAFQRMRTLEAVLEKQISTLDEAGARAQVRGDGIAARLNQESQRLESLGDGLTEAAGRAAETVAGRAAQLRATMESAEGTLKMATQSLDVQTAGFRAAITQAAEVPLEAAKTLDEQAARIEEVSTSAMGRAEFVLARQEKHRSQMQELLSTLRSESEAFEAALSQQRDGMEAAIAVLGGEAKKFEMVTGDAERHLDGIMANAATRAAQLTGAFAREAERLKDVSEAAAGDAQRHLDGVMANTVTRTAQLTGAFAREAERLKDVSEAAAGDAQKHLDGIMANASTRAAQLTSAFAREAERLKDVSEAAAGVLAALAGALRDAGDGAKTLIGESAAQAKQDARLLVGEAMAECERLLRASGEMSAEAGRIRGMLTETTRDVEKHLQRLPALAAEEAKRVRQTMAKETEQLLDVSARTMATLHARAGQKAPATDAAKPQEGDDGLKGLARKLTARKAPANGQGKNWEMKALLAAVDQSETKPAKPSVDQAVSLGALEAALADLAIDLTALDTAPVGEDDWKHYLAGDRAFFARRLADTIDDGAVDRITALYRDDGRFHDAADAYLAEFENLLARAKDDNLLTSTLLSADTGKVYLAIAYALGRL